MFSPCIFCIKFLNGIGMLTQPTSVPGPQVGHDGGTDAVPGAPW